MSSRAVPTGRYPPTARSPGRLAADAGGTLSPDAAHRLQQRVTSYRAMLMLRSAERESKCKRRRDGARFESRFAPPRRPLGASTISSGTSPLACTPWMAVARAAGVRDGAFRVADPVEVGYSPSSEDPQYTRCRKNRSWESIRMVQWYALSPCSRVRLDDRHAIRRAASAGRNQFGTLLGPVPVVPSEESAL